MTDSPNKATNGKEAGDPRDSKRLSSEELDRVAGGVTTPLSHLLHTQNALASEAGGAFAFASHTGAAMAGNHLHIDSSSTAAPAHLAVSASELVGGNLSIPSSHPATAVPTVTGSVTLHVPSTQQLDATVAQPHTSQGSVVVMNLTGHEGTFTRIIPFVHGMSEAEVEQHNAHLASIGDTNKSDYLPEQTGASSLPGLSQAGLTLNQPHVPDPPK